MPRRKPPVPKSADLSAASATMRFDLVRADGAVLAHGPTRNALVTSAVAMWDTILDADGVVRGSIAPRGRAA